MAPSHTLRMYSSGIADVYGGDMTPDKSVTVAVPAALFTLEGNVRVMSAWYNVELEVAMFHAAESFARIAGSVNAIVWIWPVVDTLYQVFSVLAV
jgi:hypothetical protein